MELLGIYVRWENSIKRRYYGVTVQSDLLGDIILIKTWGSQETKQGKLVSQLCHANKNVVLLIKAIHRQRLRHGYQLVQQQGIIL